MSRVIKFLPNGSNLPPVQAQQLGCVLVQLAQECGLQWHQCDPAEFLLALTETKRCRQDTEM